MKKTISFEKRIEFPSMIGEITAISLDHTLKFTDESNIEGEFTVSGSYKLTEASRIEENFNYKLPAEIILGERLDIDSTKLSIADFYYEIENDYTLICYIDVQIEGVEIIDLPEEESTSATEEVAKVDALPEPPETIKEEQPQVEEPPKLEEQSLNIDQIEKPTDELTRECDGEYQEETECIEEKEEIMETKTKETKTVSSLFENINDSEETYSTYSVYILREEETINSLIEKYKTTKEELESYNDLSNLTIGSKIIVPLHEE